ncbi:hypothetical protein [Pediococcus cellicola]|uniref:hypothetical protein n=1 Tax=Pediococcus cellicola TaxID=319652 RepID=UPI00070B37BE|nr:hypothetical protein [Pediococcus cellicola]GEL15449.1 polysaccharide polymerase [Pediococcus cellicola]
MTHKTIIERLRARKDNHVFFVYALYEIEYFLLGASQLSANPALSKYTRLWSLGIILLLGLIIVFLNKLNTWDWLLGGAIALLGVYSYFAVKNNNLLLGALFILSAANIDFKKFVKRDLVLRTILFVTVLFLNQIGVIASNIAVRPDTGVVRNALGFKQFNVAGAIVMSILLEYIFLHFDHINWYDVLGVAIFEGVIFKLTDSKGGLIAVGLYLVIAILNTAQKQIHPLDFAWIKGIVSWAFFGLSAISFYLVMNFRWGSSFWMKINSLLSDRINILSQYYHQYGIGLLPKQVGAYRGSGIVIMDNTYVTLGIQFGLIVLLVYGLFYNQLAIKAFNASDWALASLILVISIFGLVESSLYIVGINFTLVALLSKSREQSRKEKPVVLMNKEFV